MVKFWYFLYFDDFFSRKLHTHLGPYIYLYGVEQPYCFKVSSIFFILKFDKNHFKKPRKVMSINVKVKQAYLGDIVSLVQTKIKQISQ